MDLVIEKKLLEYKTHIIDYVVLKSILENMNYVNINDKFFQFLKSLIFREACKMTKENK